MISARDPLPRFVPSRFLPLQPVERVTFRSVDTAVGPLTLVASPRGIAAILFTDDDGHACEWPSRLHDCGVEAPSPRQRGWLDELEAWLAEYFAGKAVRPTGFISPLDPGGTPFERKVWHTLLAIPYGETCSYGQIARALGAAGAARAVGLANGKNPLPILVPCHRVIGADGRLVGFGGGLWRKIRLLELEAPRSGLFA